MQRVVYSLYIDIPKEEQDFPIKYVLISLLALLIPVFFHYLDVIHTIGLAIILSIAMFVAMRFWFVVLSITNHELKPNSAQI